MQKGGEGVQIACKIAYVINGRPLTTISIIIALLSPPPVGLPHLA